MCLSAHLVRSRLPSIVQPAGGLAAHIVVLAQASSVASRRSSASRVHVAAAHWLECGAAFPGSVDLAARRTWAVSYDGRRCASSSGRVFRLAAAARRAPLRRRSFLPLGGTLRGSSHRGVRRRRREPEPPRSALRCSSRSKSAPSSAVPADELQWNRNFFQFDERVWLHPAQG